MPLPARFVGCFRSRAVPESSALCAPGCGPLTDARTHSAEFIRVSLCSPSFFFSSSSSSLLSLSDQLHLSSKCSAGSVPGEQRQTGSTCGQKELCSVLLSATAGYQPSDSSETNQIKLTRCLDEIRPQSFIRLLFRCRLTIFHLQQTQLSSR
ncbi:hypothetical protein PAMP_021254 [Pampus punctatissimus]